jgi:Rod binding domain-containing protein
MDVVSRPQLPMVPTGFDPAQLARQAQRGDARTWDAVAVGFEELFLTQLVKQMRQTLEPGALFPQDDSDILGGLFDMTMGQHLARAGALGIGALLQQQLMARSGS